MASFVYSNFLLLNQFWLSIEAVVFLTWNLGAQVNGTPIDDQIFVQSAFRTR